jgi:hypothetical protein
MAATQHLGGPSDSEDLRERSLGELLRQLSEQAIPLVPEQTIETVKEDVEWAKTQTRSAKT